MVFFSKTRVMTDHQLRNVVGVITGLMGSGKTTLLYHLFGLPPPDIYTSTGVTEQSFQGLLHHILHLYAGTWHRMSHRDIRVFLAPLIRARMREDDVDSLASRLIHDITPTATTSVPTSSLDHAPRSSSDTVPVTSTPVDPAPHPLMTTMSRWSKIEALCCLRRSHSQSPLQRHRSSQTVVNNSPCCRIIALLTASDSHTLPDHPLLEMAHMIDTGGQPELMEVMPSLIHNADLAIALLNLEYSLNEHQQIDYHENGQPYTRDTPSRLTGRDIILKLASTLHGKKSLHEPFRLLNIATVWRLTWRPGWKPSIESYAASYSQHSE